MRDHLLALDPALTVELIIIKTAGDRILDTPLAKIGGKGLFIKELEQALLDNAADIAVHSMKDVPVELPPTLHIPCVLEREDPRDCLVAPNHEGLNALPSAAVVGTSSLRRRSQLAMRRRDLRLRDLRGNVTTRLAKVAKLAGAPMAATAGLTSSVRIGDRLNVGDLLYSVHAESHGELEYALTYANVHTTIFNLSADTL